MKWRLTVQFLLSVLTIVVIVIFVNSAIFIGLLIYQQSTVFQDSYAANNEQFVRDFEQNISLENGRIIFDEDGLQLLKERNAWIQVLDNNGTVIAEHNTPKNILAHYTPLDLVQMYKYREIDKDTIVYVGGNETFSYLIGIKDIGIQRYVLNLSTTSILSTIGKFGLFIVIADLLVATIVGWFFGRTLTKPLYHLIEQIQRLKNRNHTQIKKPKGIYGPVFSNLNEVSGELAAHELERKRLETMREEWISNVSHDMKTPLASIRGYAELLSDGDSLPSEQAEYARIIEKQSLHMKELLDDLNLTMRLRHNQLPLQLLEVNIVQFLREIVIDTLNMPQYEQSNITFESSNEKIVRLLDVHFMRRAIVNFLHNALLHNPVDVEVIVFVNEECIKISDNGNGISEENLNHIFERYYRGTNTEHTHGTGLGTAIAHDIIKAHGWSVYMTSKETVGTTVFIQMT